MFTKIVDRLDFIRRIIINFFFVIFLTIFLIGLFIFPFFKEDNVEVKGHILSLKTNDISDRNSSYLGPQNNLTIYEVVKAFEIASTDDDVEIIFLDVSYLNISSVSAYEVGKSINLLKEKGKKVIAYGDFFTQSQYLLASYADEIILNPFGMVYLEGFKKYQIYLKEFLINNKINVNTFVAGDYKSATEIFTNSEMSIEDKEQSKVFLNDLWNNWILEINKNRKKLKIDINYFINNFNDFDINLTSAEKAKKYGLVDEILNRVELRNYFIDLNNLDHNIDSTDPKILSLESYFKSKKPPKPTSDKIVILNAYGEIIDGSFQENQISSEFYARKIREISNDPEIKGLLLRVNSPGGSGFASEIIRQELLNLKKLKIPIIVSISDVAASGGYWISANANEIWATPLSVTGSIGVFALLPSIEDALSSYVIEYDGISTTEFNPSLISNPDSNLKNYIQNYVDRAYLDFIELVSDGREIATELVKEISDGKIWTGTQALDNGLIDNLGTQSEALNRLKEIIGNEEIEVEYLNFEQTFLDFVRTNIFNFNSFFSIFSKELSLKNFLFKEFYFLEKNIIDLRLDCINCSIK